MPLHLFFFLSGGMVCLLRPYDPIVLAKEDHASEVSWLDSCVSSFSLRQGESGSDLSSICASVSAFPWALMALRSLPRSAYDFLN